MQYQYCETDPFKRPTHLLEANPRGMVPAIREGDWASGESAVILEYVSQSFTSKGLICSASYDSNRSLRTVITMCPSFLLIHD